jgi:hypothetical protein
VAGRQRTQRASRSARLQQLGRQRDAGGLRAALHRAAFRKWSELRVANTAFGAISFLALEAIGGTMLLQLRLHQRALGDPVRRRAHHLC